MNGDPKKILYLITDSGTGGSEQILLQLLMGLDRNRVNPADVLVLKTKREMAAQWEKCGVRVLSFGMHRWPTPQLLLALRAELKRIKPDIVHAFLFHSCQIARILHSTWPHFQLITSPRVNYRIIPKWAQCVDAILKRRDRLALAESSTTKEFLVSHLGYSDDKTIVVLNGVNTSRYQYHPDHRLTWRKKWNIADDKILIGGVGRLNPQKAFDVLIRAVQRVPDAQLVLVGEGAEEFNLKQLAQKFSVPVVFAGRCENMSEIYSAFDIYVQSSRYEGMSNALLEAMSVGLPIVATNIDGTLDVAQDGENMLLVPPDDELALAEKLLTLTRDVYLRKKISMAARRTALDNTTDNMIKKFQNTYLQLS